MTEKKKYAMFIVVAVLIILIIGCIAYAMQRSDEYDYLSTDDKIDLKDEKLFKKKNHLPKDQEEAIWKVILEARTLIRRDLVDITGTGENMRAIKPTDIQFDIPDVSTLFVKDHFFELSVKILDCIVITGSFLSRDSGRISFEYHLGIVEKGSIMYLGEIEMTPGHYSKHIWKKYYDVDWDDFWTNPF